MKFVVENEAFAKALSHVKSCVPTHSTMPILAHIAIEADVGHVTVRATNLDREAEARIPAEIPIAGGMAVPGDVVAAMARRLPKGGQCTFEVDDDRAKVSSGTAKFDLRTLPVADFPSKKELGGPATTFTMKASALKDLFGATSYATLTKSPKAYHKGVYLHVRSKKLVAVGSDDHRFALQSVEMPAGSATMPGVIIPAEAVRDLMASLDTALDQDVDLSVSASLFELRVPGLRFATLLVDAVFPDYDRFVPKPNGAGAVVRPYALAEAAERAAVVYLGDKGPNQRVPIIGIKRKEGALALDAGVKGNELGAEEIDAETNDHDLSFTVNAPYLMDALKVWPEDIELSIQQDKPGGPILFWAKTRPDKLHLIMPTLR